MNKRLSKYALGFVLLAAQVIAQTKPPTKADSNGSMVLIHGGSIEAGIDVDDIPRLQKLFGIGSAELFHDEMPKHSETVADFYMDEYLVTNAQFKKFTEPVRNGSRGGLRLLSTMVIISAIGVHQNQQALRKTILL